MQKNIKDMKKNLTFILLKIQDGRVKESNWSNIWRNMCETVLRFVKNINLHIHKALRNYTHTHTHTHTKTLLPKFLNKTHNKGKGLKNQPKEQNTLALKELPN